MMWLIIYTALQYKAESILLKYSIMYHGTWYVIVWEIQVLYTGF